MIHKVTENQACKILEHVLIFKGDVNAAFAYRLINNHLTKDVTEKEARDMIYRYLKNWNPGPMFLNKLIDCIPKKHLNELLDTDGLRTCVADSSYKYKIKN